MGKEILKGNKLIAEFMGDKVMCTYDSFGKRYSSLFSVENVKDWSNAFLQYHTSWDWLMPVCHKLDYLVENKNIQWSSDYEFFCDKLDDAVTRTYTIEPIWLVVVEFIQWYNSTKKP